MAVIIDRRILRRFHQVLGRDERRLRAIVHDTRHRLNLRRHAAARPNLRRAGRALFTRGDWRAASTAAPALAPAASALSRKETAESHESETGNDELAAHEDS